MPVCLLLPGGFWREHALLCWEQRGEAASAAGGDGAPEIGDFSEEGLGLDSANLGAVDALAQLIVLLRSGIKVGGIRHIDPMQSTADGKRVGDAPTFGFGQALIPLLDSYTPMSSTKRSMASGSFARPAACATLIPPRSSDATRSTTSLGRARTWFMQCTRRVMPSMSLRSLGFRV